MIQTSDTRCNVSFIFTVGQFLSCIVLDSLILYSCMAHFILGKQKKKKKKKTEKKKTEKKK